MAMGATVYCDGAMNTNGVQWPPMNPIEITIHVNVRMRCYKGFIFAIAQMDPLQDCGKAITSLTRKTLHT